MAEPIFYFAYGSNMAIERLRPRVPSAELRGVAVLLAHELKFHKRSKRDGSAKCDVFYTGKEDDKVFGALYVVAEEDVAKLDRFEGLGQGYNRRSVTVVTIDGLTFRAQTYVATDVDPTLQPFDWYKEHVLRGARSIGLPAEYVTRIERVVAMPDANSERRLKELAIYSEHTCTAR